MSRAFCWLLLLLSTETALAQLSGFASATYSYQANPLYNYEKISDHVVQSYLELTYDKEYDASTVQAQYVSGLMVFDRLSPRNYYEHTLALTYRQQLAPLDEEYSDDGASAAALAGMTRGKAFLLNLKAGARYDRSIYKEYDNSSVSLTAAYSNGTTEQFFGISNRAEYRSYTYLPELSSITDVLSLRLLAGPDRHTAYGVFGGIGIKRFTVDAVDTLQFATGSKGRGKSISSGQGASKKIMTNEQSRSTTQAELGLAGYKTWRASSIDALLRYRWNIGDNVRYVAQVARTTILSDDIYNDHFSYEGPDAEVTYRQELPLAVRATLKAIAARRTYGAPAFSALGEQRAENRRDLHGALEFSISRYFALTETVGLDLTASAGALRNQSNDEYNDFSATSLSIGLGVGF